MKHFHDSKSTKTNIIDLPIKVPPSSSSSTLFHVTVSFDRRRIRDGGAVGVVGAWWFRGRAIFDIFVKNIHGFRAHWHPGEPPVCCNVKVKPGCMLLFE